MNNSFNTALTQKTDLRELIPELFCFPEMFYNSNNLNLGELSENIEGVTNENSPEKKTIVNDVGMPKWSNNDGYTFIQKHRELLESPAISEKINEWFNIIFGSKQKGSAAKKINNLFLDQTYDDFEEQHEKSSLEDKINQYRMVEFGVTPNQVFKSDVNKRKSYNEIKHKQLLYNTTTAIKNGDKNNKFLNFEEIDCDFNEEKPYRIFDFKKEGFKKWRIYILTKKCVKIFTKTKEKIEIDEENNENIDDLESVRSNASSGWESIFSSEELDEEEEEDENKFQNEYDKIKIIKKNENKNKLFICTIFGTKIFSLESSFEFVASSNSLYAGGENKLIFYGIMKNPEKKGDNVVYIENEEIKKLACSQNVDS
jgi:hypothetical protein